MNGNSGASNGGGLFIENIICQVRSESATSAASAVFYSACSALLVVMVVVKSWRKNSHLLISSLLKGTRNHLTGDYLLHSLIP